MAKVIALDNIPEVRLLEDITRDSAARLIEQLSQFKGQRVALSIFSNGGDVHGSRAVASYISNPANEMQVEARVYGNAASGAMIICAACQKAYISAGAFALVHKAHAVNAEGVRVPEAELSKEEVAVLNVMNADQISLFQKRTGKTAASIEKLMEQDRDMPADEAVEFGLFDGIIPQAARLAAYKQIPPTMAEDKKTREFKVKVARTLDNISAMATGNEVVVQIPEELIAADSAAKVSTLNTEIDELKGKLAAAETAKAALETEKATELTAKAKLEIDLIAANDKATAFEVAMTNLKKNPLVAQTMPDGTSVVIPGAPVNEDSTKGKSAKEISLEASANAFEDAKKQYLQQA